MRMVYASEEIERLEFARKAAQHFAENPGHNTYTDGEIEPGCLFGLRWGLSDDCVLVIKLHDYEAPVNYQNLVREYTDTEKEPKP